MREQLRHFYTTLDLRSLALFRVALALLLLHDTATRWPDIQAFYSSTGILPADAPWPRFNAPLQWSLLDPLRSTGAIQIAFVVGFMAELALLAGFHTRWARLACVLFFFSVRNRNLLLTHGGDGALSVLCLWSLFLPMAARWSFDAWQAARRTRMPPPQVSVPSLTGLAYAVQIGFIYLTTAIAKSGAAWHDGTAVYFALHIDQFANAFGLWVRDLPIALLKFLSWGTYVLEWAALPLLLSPVGRPWARRIAILGLAGFHIGTAVTMTLGSFPWVMCASFLPLVRPCDWDDLRGLWARVRGSRPVAPSGSAMMPIASAAVRRAVDALAIALLVCLLLDGFNQSWAQRLGRPSVPLPLVVRAPVLAFDLGQGWRMFAPEPLRRDGWWVMVAETESGGRLDPLTGAPPRWEKPPRLSESRGIYWRMFLFNISQPKFRPFQIYYARWLAGRTGAQPPERRLRGFDLYWMQEETPEPGQPAPALQRFRLWSWDGTADVIRPGDI